MAAFTTSFKLSRNNPLSVSSNGMARFSIGLDRLCEKQSILALMARMKVLLMRKGVPPFTIAILSRSLPMGTTMAWLLVRVPGFQT